MGKRLQQVSQHITDLTNELPFTVDFRDCLSSRIERIRHTLLLQSHLAEDMDSTMDTRVVV
jgi:hypothetical protein